MAEGGALGRGAAMPALAAASSANGSNRTENATKNATLALQSEAKPSPHTSRVELEYGFGDLLLW